MENKIERILDVTELRENVEEYKNKEQERKRESLNNNLLKIKDYLMTIQHEIIQASKEGKTEYRFIRYESLKSKAYSEEIKMFFEQQGLKVEMLMDFRSSYYNDYDLFFPHFGGVIDSIKYTFIVSWK